VRAAVDKIDKKSIPDVQSRADDRGIPLDKAGVTNVTIPMHITTKSGDKQNVIADISMNVFLPHHYKGTHMSRFVEIINNYHGCCAIDVNELTNILKQTKQKLDSEASFIEIRFPFFREKVAPVSKKKSFMDYKCRIDAELNEQLDIILEVKVPVATVCPCSKEISKYGAHNQRSDVTVRVRFEGKIFIEDIIDAVERSASIDLYTLLKREDEKYVTEKGYENPKFAEDLVRDIALELRKNKQITWYSISVENLESIHNHNAYAYVEQHDCSKPPPQRKLICFNRI